MAEPSSGQPPRPAQLYSQAPPHDLPSAPSSASLQSPLTPGTGMSHHGPTSRPSSGLGAPHFQLMNMPPSAPRSAGYNQTYHPSSASQGVQLPGYQDLAHPSYYSIGASGMLANTQLPSIGPQGQKRAYRQRRKDPSCDACRERKVKCDATDSSSCTECTSRNVKCQFTKETNRRMTSMKHNQDLTKELANAQAELNRLRSQVESTKHGQPVHNLSAAHLPGPEPSHLPSHNLSHLPGPESAHLAHYALDQFPLYDQRPFKRKRTLGSGDLSKVGANMQKYGRGIFKPPYPHQQTPSPVSFSSALPGLPPKSVADALLRQYRFTLHPTLPMLHWESFEQRYEDVYREGSLQHVPRIWSGLLFAVFAVGTLHRSWKDGQNYLEISRGLIDMWTEDLTLDHARAALLSSIFLVEMNLKSAGWTWIGFAVRISFDIGLHCEAGTWPAIEEEMRRRVWWSIYACDCLLSLELGRPALIKEEDCDVSMPSPIDDQYMHADGKWLSPTQEQSTSPLLPTIQVIGGIAKLLCVLKSPRLAKSALQVYEAHFNKCMGAFPAQHQIRINDYVDPIELPPIMYLQNARLMLHRHNISPVCDSDTRSAALDNCASAAKDTAKFLRRCMQEPPPDSECHITAQNDTWEKRMVSGVSAFFCTHIWRCTLFLIFRFDFESALLCARASATLGDSRPINTACGRYLEFFLDAMTTELGHGAQLDTNEEMIAYVSGDLQGSFENSWIWQETKGNVHLGKPLGSSVSDDKTANKLENGETASLEDQPWAGWDNILRTLEHLVQDKRKGNPQAAGGEIPQRSSGGLPALAPSPNPSILQAASNRMSIRDLIENQSA